MSWRDLALGDVLTLQRGFDITKAQQSAGPFPVVSSSGVNSYHSEFKCNGPGVIIGRKGTLGTAFFLEGAYWPHDTSLWVKDFKGNDPRFCYYLLKSLGLEKYDVGSSNPTLNRNHLHLLEARAPSPEIQRRIADILSAYDDLIENNTRRISILEDTARRLFEEWFGQGAEAGWPTVKLGTLAAINPESISPKSPPAQIGYIDIASVSPGKVDQVQWMDFADAPGRARRIVRNGDVIWSNVRPNRRSFALLLDVEQNSIASTGFSVLRAKAVPCSYLYVATTTSDFTAYLTNRAKGSAYPAVGSEDFADADVLQPDDETLERFHVHVGPMLELAARLNAQSSNLRTTRDLLLPKLISGDIEVRAAEAELETAAA